MFQTFSSRGLIAATAIFLGLAGARVSAQCGTWTKLSPGNHPGQRALHVMAYDSQRSVTVLFGGLVAGYSNQTWEWNGTIWSLLSPAAAPSPRFLSMMAYDSARGRIVLFGGNASGILMNDTWEWDGTNWTQVMTATSPSVRTHHGIAFDSQRNRTVLFGGLGLNDTWEYDGANWTQIMPGNFPSKRTGTNMVYDSIRKVCVLFGGLGPANAVSGETWEYDGTTWYHRTPASAPSPRWLSQVAFDSSSGRTILHGGVADSGATYLDETWEWDGTNWIQMSPFTSPGQRISSAMVYDTGNSVALLFGGFTQNPTATPADTWTYQGPLPRFTKQPQSQTITAGQTVLLTVAATVTGTAGFQWQMNGNDLVDGGAILGSTAASLFITGASATNAGQYACRVSNGGCGSTLSDTATLTFDACKVTAGSAEDCNSNGILDSCEIAADPSLDKNGNGKLDSCEGSASCGTCGAGAAMMMPLTILGLAVNWRRQRG